jgi:hypothetical protein
MAAMTSHASEEVVFRDIISGHFGKRIFLESKPSNHLEIINNISVIGGCLSKWLLP